ncbi:MAG: peptidoglycan-binding protein [Deltaproteobacteria bacterium]|nr:peptidoglycan-binding protein [Deltaproteobacteria bacterium]
MTTLSTIAQDARVTRQEVGTIESSVARGTIDRPELETFVNQHWDIFDSDARTSINGLLGRIGAPQHRNTGTVQLRSEPSLSAVFSGDVVLGRERNPTHESVVFVQRALMALAKRDENPRLMPEGGADGNFGTNTDRAVRAFQEDVMRLPDDEVDGLVGPDTIAALDDDLRNGEPTSPTPPTSSTGRTRFSFTPNADALRTAKRSAAGARFVRRTPEFASIYRRAESLTGVPAEFLAALHANESGQSESRSLGPESGFGLDDRWVTTGWANRQLARYGLGTWARGQNSSRAALQSAVVAAEHFKRNAGAIDVRVGPSMTTREVAGAVTCYTSGIRSGQSALRSGRSWMFDPNDTNPHPLHPGGTSRTAGGRTVRVPPGRKEGLLRWDVLIPMASEILTA